MTLGLGIFLSTLLVVFVLLYRWYGEQWKLARKLKITSLVLVVVLVVGFAGVWGYNAWENRPQMQTGYYGVQLGMNANEVLYVLGQPSSVSEPPAKGEQGWPITKFEDIPKDKTIRDYISWFYEGDQVKPRVDIRFLLATKKVRAVACYATATQYCHAVNGVGIGTTEEAVIKQLGEPSETKMQDTVKILKYKNQRVSFFLAQKAVYMIVVADLDGPKI